MMNMFEGICGKVAPGMCRLSMDGSIAVKTGSGYRSYNMQKGRLTNCDSFVLDIGDDFFFVLPASKVHPGDIILVRGKPRCVIEAEAGTITVINYEDMTIEKLLPEHHVFMGNTFIYSRIVSLFGRNGVRGKKGMGKMMKYMMLSSMMKNGDKGGDKAGALLPFMMMGGLNGDGGFGELFDFDEDDEEFGMTEEA